MSQRTRTAIGSECWRLDQPEWELRVERRAKIALGRGGERTTLCGLLRTP
jgi:hypothetical protein